MIRPWLLPCGVLLACAEPTEAVRVDLLVGTAANTGTASTDLGYAVTITRARLAVTAVEFTIGGETHDELELEPTGGGWPRHPGHAAGGEVTGELPGAHVLVFDDAPHALGTGTLLVGAYQGANFTFRQADADDVDAGDPLHGHAAHLELTVTSGDAAWLVDAVVDLDPGTQLVGAVFDQVIAEDATAPLAIALLPTDPAEGGTCFDGLAFAELPALPDGTVTIRPGDVAHNVLRRQLVVHDHYAVSAAP